MMNILFFLHPKSEIKYIYDDCSLRKGIELMRGDGYSAIPVINREGKYVTTISEGDFLNHIIDKGECSLKKLEDTLIGDIAGDNRNPAVSINATMGDLISRAMEQNFVPVTDDRGMFVGIITRKDIIKFLATEEGDIK